MKLQAYLAREGITQGNFAKIVTSIAREQYGLEVEIKQQAISQYCKRGNLPSRAELVCAIYLATNGEVAPNDFYDLPALSSTGERAA